MESHLLSQQRHGLILEVNKETWNTVNSYSGYNTWINSVIKNDGGIHFLIEED